MNPRTIYVKHSENDSNPNWLADHFGSKKEMIFHLWLRYEINLIFAPLPLKLNCFPFSFMMMYKSLRFKNIIRV
jgi:hypothetical protein